MIVFALNRVWIVISFSILQILSMSPLKKGHLDKNVAHYDPYITALPHDFHGFWQIFKYFQ
jgi:hypothetical protein